MSTVQDVTRREMIASYGVIGAPPEPDLEGLVQLAATVCGVSTAVINIIDDRFQHQIAAVGFTPAVCAREDSMCAVVFQHPGHVVVPDAREDDRFRDNPFVTGEIADVRFYASSPLITPQGIPIGTLCVFDEEVGELAPEDSRALALLAHQVVDVLELRRLTHELGQSNEQLERFAGQISHDLRNPLMALAGFIELAADSPELAGAPQAARALSRAESAAERMGAMIGDLYAYARLGGSRPRRETVDLGDLIAAVGDDLDTALAETGARIEAHVDASLHGDPTLLRALLQNLIANAVKFTAATGITPRVVIRSHRLTGGWRLTVDDNGPGVPAERREAVFELMDRGGVDDVPGLGIGLSTCRRIVEAHGGRIGIDEAETGGASVWIVIPDIAA
ncbi:MAG TPA: histidine kinase [Microbacterium sp.]|jgi:signal transduction histidine kinase|uniref:sensor histidine kinase n=1 Tax=Microbacterium sp. UBA1612 TaxID=1946942 RepID=UPI0008DA062F|nr:GAF domain-containing sensor histidine kinase [Microbacterium sp. UBA1612]HBR87893.1 histidine kinase [Microbacterium sp.]HBS75092.1 histidine kinase [Microbacterium sp.]|tara:strand:+ start:120471 stop:121649 length:1179 start_codon:yes stop_codon:yes gene_type:complete